MSKLYCSFCKKELGEIKEGFALTVKYLKARMAFISLHVSKAHIICDECKKTRWHEVMDWLKKLHYPFR